MFIIPGFIAAVMRSGGKGEKTKVQLAADTLCCALLILAGVSGMLYALFDDNVFSAEYHVDVLLYAFSLGHTASRLFWGSLAGERDSGQQGHEGFCLPFPGCG